MKRFLLLVLCVLATFAGFAQSERVVRGVVMDANDAPLVDATVKAVGSSEIIKSGPGGMFTMTVSPFVKFIEASFEGYVTMQGEIDGSYLIFRLKEDKKYWDNKAKAEAEKAKAEEAARIAEEKRLAAEKAAAEKAAAEKAKADEAARIAEEKRLAAEKAKAEKAAAEKAKAEETARIAEQKRLAAEKAKAEKAAAEKAKAEAAARLAEQKRLEQERIAEEKRLAAEKAKAEKAAAEKAKAEAAARLAEQKRLEQERIAEEKRIAAEKAKAAKVVTEKANVDETARISEETNVIRSKHSSPKRAKAVELRPERKGYASYLETTYSLTISEMHDWIGMNYIGGYQFNDKLFLGLGVGANIADSDEKLKPIKKGQLPKIVSYYSFPAFVHFRYNFLNRICSPLFALSVGVRYAPSQDFPFELGVVNYDSFGVMAHPQIGLNFRIARRSSIYIAAGYECYTAPVCIENTGYSATFEPGLYSNITFSLGVNF